MFMLLTDSLFQPPFDGDDDDQLFNNIMEKPVHYPRGLSDQAKKIIQGVSGSVGKGSSNARGCDDLYHMSVKGHQ